MTSPEQCPAAATPPTPAQPLDGHEPPTFTRLGTLAELTLGPPGGTEDGFGGFNGDGGGGSFGL